MKLNSDEIDVKSLSIYEKMNFVINDIRVQKNGKNTFSNYEYFKPDEINRNVNPLFLRYRLFPRFYTEFKDFPTEEILDSDKNLISIKHNYKEIAYLRIKDLDTDNYVEYQMPLELPEIKGANVMQKIRRSSHLCEEVFVYGSIKYLG